MKKLTALLLVVFLIFSTTLCGCTNKNPIRKYKGNWVSDTKDDGYRYELSIESDGKLAIRYFESTNIIQWEYAGSALIEEDAGKEVIVFSLDIGDYYYVGKYEYKYKSKKLNLTLSSGESVFTTSETLNDGKVTLIKDKSK